MRLAVDPDHPAGDLQAGRTLRSFSAPYDYFHDRYQAYYLAGLCAHLAAGGGRHESSRGWPRGPLLKALRAVKHSHRLRPALTAVPQFGRWLDRAARLMTVSEELPAGRFHPLVGQYLLNLGPTTVRFCIDAQDSGAIASPELLDWSDCYFKTNYWPNASSPSKLIPLANGNPLLLGRIHDLKALRQVETQHDVAFIVRVWGGKDETEGVEHNLRLIEAINRTNCRKFLRAYLVAGNIEQAARRLDAQQIPWTTEPMPIRELWRISAASRLVVIRLGMHQCLPWRMMDSLAMGSCVVLDQDPKTIWHQSLRRGEHFLSLEAPPADGGGYGRAIDQTEAHYDEIPARLEALLRDGSQIDRIRSSARTLFDESLEPRQMGRFIVETAVRHAQAGRSARLGRSSGSDPESGESDRL